MTDPYATELAHGIPTPHKHCTPTVCRVPDQKRTRLWTKRSESLRREAVTALNAACNYWRPTSSQAPRWQETKKAGVGASPAEAQSSQSSR